MIFNAPLAFQAATLQTPHFERQRQEFQINSDFLKRAVTLTVLLPDNFKREVSSEVPVLFMHDGQELDNICHQENISHLSKLDNFEAPIVVAIHANSERLSEYGVVGTLAFAKDEEGKEIILGTKALGHQRFLIEELLPFIEQHYPISGNSSKRALMGCSAGAVPTFDIGVRYPDLFGTLGLFSGSFWWRSEHFDKSKPHANRILHNTVDQWQKNHNTETKFWFQAGHLEESREKGIRGGGDIIDAVYDTRTLIDKITINSPAICERIRYLELPHGVHKYTTWSKTAPDFLKWAFKRSL